MAKIIPTSGVGHTLGLIGERPPPGDRGEPFVRAEGGRPSVMDAKKVATARKLYDSQEHTVAEIAAMLDVSVATVYRHLRSGTAA